MSSLPYQVFNEPGTMVQNIRKFLGRMVASMKPTCLVNGFDFAKAAVTRGITFLARKFRPQPPVPDIPMYPGCTLDNFLEPEEDSDDANNITLFDRSVLKLHDEIEEHATNPPFKNFVAGEPIEVGTWV